MKYQNTKNGQVATVIEHDDVRKTTMLELEDGMTKVLSDTTVKRWWKEVKEEPELVPMPGTEGNWGEKHYGEELAGDGTSYKQVMQEIIEDGKKHVEEVMKQKKDLGIEVKPIKKVTIVEEKGKKVDKVLKVDDRKLLMDEILSMLKKDKVNYVAYSKIPNMLVIRQGKKSVFEVRVKKSGITFNCREVDRPDGIDFHTVNNYYMPVVINSTKDDWTGVFESLLDSAKNYGKEA